MGLFGDLQKFHHLSKQNVFHCLHMQMMRSDMQFGKKLFSVVLSQISCAMHVISVLMFSCFLNQTILLWKGVLVKKIMLYSQD